MISQNKNPCAACPNADGCLCKGIGSPKVCRGPDTCMAHEAQNHHLFDVNESLIQLNPADGLKLTGWFRPANWDDPGANKVEVFGPIKPRECAPQASPDLPGPMLQ